MNDGRILWYNWTMKNILDTITKVGKVLLAQGARFASSPALDGDPSYHGLFAGDDDVIVWDNSERSQWCVRLDLDRTPEDKDHLPDLVSSALGAPVRTYDNGVRNWEVDGVLVVASVHGVEFFLDYVRVTGR